MRTKTSSTRQYILLLALLIIASILGYQRYTDHIAETPTETYTTGSTAATPSNNHIKGVRMLLGGVTDPSLISSAAEKGAWAESESEIHLRALKSRKYDYIVLPVQESRSEIDRPAGLLSSRYIASSMASQMGKRVMSPEQILRLLGGRASIFDEDDVSEIAKITGAKVLHIFHVSNHFVASNTPSIVLVLADSNGDVQRQQAFSIDSPSLSRPLDSIVEPLAKQMVETFFAPEKNTGSTANEPGSELWVFPDFLAQLPEIDVTYEQKAAYLQLLAILTPEEFQYDRERLFERSLMALKLADPNSPHVTLLKSRALFHLFRRPAAIKLLASPKSTAERAFLEFLNGNYPELRELVPSINDQLLRLIARAELASLGFKYDLGPLPESESETLSHQWTALFESAYRDEDSWYAPNNIVFFSTITGLFPDFDRRLEIATRERLVTGDMSDADDISKLIDEVLDAGIRRPDSPGCCASYGIDVEISDIWLLYRNLFLGNLLRDLYRSAYVHAAYDTALDRAKAIEPYLAGHPRYSRLLARAYEGQAERSRGDERATQISKARDLAFETSINSGYTDIDTIRARGILRRLRRHNNTGIQHPNSDFNIGRLDFPTGIRRASIHRAAEALPYFHGHLGLVEQGLIDGSLSEEQVQHILRTQLNGHPGRAVYLAELLVKKGQREQAVSLLRKEIERSGKSQGPFTLLGELLIDEQDYNGASEVYLRYPSFQKIPEGHRVKVTNIAEEYGSRLYWLGRHKEAPPFYEIAVGLNTGSGAQYASGQRLALMAGDYMTALQYAFQRAQRYNSRFAFRDYLALLHLMGQHEDAEAGARALIPRYDEPQIWTSLFVGDRMQQRSVAEISDWISESISYQTRPDLRGQAVRYLFMSALTDRSISTETLQEINPLIGSSGVGKTNSQNSLVSAHLRPLLGKPADVKTLDCDVPICQSADADVFRGEHFAFLTAYHYLQTGKAELALSEFVKLDQYHNIFANENSQYAMPYFSISLAAALPSSASQGILEFVQHEYSDEDKNFDMELSKAVLNVALSNREQAIAALIRAFHARPHTMTRPIFSWYQITDVAQWMAKESGDDIYIEMALEWARRYQIIQPQFGWAYAFEARYSKVKADRVRAAAFATYLDADSKWLGEVPQDIRDQADLWWHDNNPFTDAALERANETTSL